MSIVSVGDGFDANPIVRTAVEALSAFGGDLSYGQAQRLLPMWAYHGELTDRERTAVLARFPRGCGDLERDLPVPDAEAGYELATGTGRHADQEPGPAGARGRVVAESCPTCGETHYPTTLGAGERCRTCQHHDPKPMGDDSSSGPGWPLNGR